MLVDLPRHAPLGMNCFVTFSKAASNRVVSSVGYLEDVPAGYQAMKNREAIKAMIKFEIAKEAITIWQVKRC